MMITLAQLQQVCVSEGGKKRAAEFLPFLNAAFADPAWGITSRRRMVYFLAQIMHESGEFQYVRELADGSAYTTRKDLGNTTKEAVAAAAAKKVATGPFYKGAGLIQITGYFNFKKCSQALFGDDRLVNGPELLCEKEWAVKSALWFWTSRKPSLNTLADADEFTKVTKVINGGTNGLQDRLSYLRRLNKAVMP